MDRRDLLRGIVAAGVLPAVGGSRRASLELPNESPAQDEPIVVEGLFAGTIRASHLKGMQEGGVHCGVAGGPGDVASYGALLRFFDQHKDEVVLARGRARRTLPARDATLDDLRGPTGGFRAPMLKAGRRLLVGFNKDALEETLR